MFPDDEVKTLDAKVKSPGSRWYGAVLLVCQCGSMVVRPIPSLTVEE